jgi:hypothetical protein
MIKRLVSFFGKERGGQPEPQVAIDQLGKVSQVDWNTAAPGVEKRQVIEMRVQLMKGSYGNTPGLIIDIVREVKKSRANEFNLETAHDALVTILQKSGLPVDLTDKESIDAAIVAYTDKRKGN